MSHALIVGGGLIGLLTARALRAHGHAVTVLDRGALGHEASSAGGGILSPLHPWRFPDAVTALAGRAQAVWPGLVAELVETGVDAEYRPGGMLVLGDDDPAEVAAWSARHGVSVEPLDPGRLASMEPGLHAREAHAWLLPDVAGVRPPAVLQGIARLAAREGVALREQVRVSAIALERGRAVGVDTEAGRIAGDLVVVSAGAWSPTLLAGLGAAPPGIRPIRGQMVSFGSDPAQLRHIVLSRNHYLIPRRDGIVAGSTLEDVGFDASATVDARAELVSAAAALLPALSEAPVTDHWAGLRPGSDDGVPTIAAHPSVGGLWINAGHFRNGIVTAPASAEILAALVAGATPELDPAPYGWPLVDPSG